MTYGKVFSDLVNRSAIIIQFEVQFNGVGIPLTLYVERHTTVLH